MMENGKNENSVRLFCNCGNTSDTTKFPSQLTKTQTLIAAALGPCVNNSPAAIHGIEPGPSAKNTTKDNVATIKNIPTASLPSSWKFNAMVIMMEHITIPASPVRCKVLRPNLSINGMVTSVMVTSMAPTPMVAYWALSGSIPALSKKLVE